VPKLLLVSTVATTLRGFLIPYAKHFRNLGWRVDGAAFGATDDPDCIEAFDSVFNVPWSRSPLSRQNFSRAPAQIRDIVQNGAYDIVHVHTPVAAFLSRCALRHSRKRGKPRMIYTCHGFHFHPRGSRLYNLFYLTLEKIGGKWTDYLVVINQSDRQMAERHKLVPPQRLRYMPGIGVDTRVYSPESVPGDAVHRIRQELRLEDEDRLFLMIAEFNPNKRHNDALYALALTKNERIHIAFAGHGGTEPQIAELAARLGLTSRVHFLGFRNDIPALIRASTATLLTSEREGLSRSVLESMSLGVPVVGSDIRGIRELLQSGGGLLVRPGDRQELANAMEQLANQPGLASTMAQSARHHVINYDTQKLLRLHEELYAEALHCGALGETIVPGRQRA
jgi:glycosyltransferase involved in cell wall biosynthesis